MKMKKNIVLVVLGLLLTIAVMFGFLNSQKLETALKASQAQETTLQTQLKESKAQNKELSKQVDQLSQLKTGYVIEGMTATVSRFFKAAFTFKAEEDTYASRKAEARPLAADSVFNQFFVDDVAMGSPTLMDSEVQAIKVYIENTHNSVTTGIVTYTLNNKIGESLDKSSVMFYRFTYDATLNQLLSAERMERFVPTN